MKSKVTVCIILIFGVGVWTSLPLVSSISESPGEAVGLASAFAFGATIAGSVGAPMAGSLVNTRYAGLSTASLLAVSIATFAAALLWPSAFTLGLFGGARMFTDTFLFFFLNKQIGRVDASGDTKTRLTSLLMLGTQTRTLLAAPAAGVAVSVSHIRTILPVILSVMTLFAVGAAVLVSQMNTRPSVEESVKEAGTLQQRFYREFIAPGRQALQARWFRVLVLGDAVRSLTGGALIVVMASVVASQTSSVGYAYTAIAMSLTAGGLLANLAINRWPNLLSINLRYIAIAASVHVLVLLSVGFNSAVWVICILASIAMAGQSFYYVGYLRIVQNEVPEEQTGRWLAVDTFLSTVTAPIGLALVVPLTSALGGSEAAYLVAAGIWLLVLLLQWKPLTSESRLFAADDADSAQIGVR